MKFISNWKTIAARSHSMWSFYLSLVCLVGPEVLYLILGRDLASPRFWWGLAAALLIYGIVGRLKDQGIDS